jgi:CheY-like chemotaxis protein
VAAAPAPTGKGELVLITEDDPDVRRIVASMLSRAGYHTFEAADGAEALALAEVHAIRVLVTDMLMPRMNGVELARRLRERHPTLGVLLLSGYPGDPAVLQSLPPGTVFLQKPVQATELIERVRSVL